VHTAAPPTDDDLYDHVRTGAEGDPRSKLNRRRKGDPGVSLEQLMRFFDPGMTKKMDDSTEVSDRPRSTLTRSGLLLCLSNSIRSLGSR
jgi:hypothetical protein